MGWKGLRDLWSIWGQRLQLVVFLVLGTVFALLHHFMGVHLKSRPVPPNISICGVQISNQAYVSALSNTLSQIVKFLFASTIGLAFTQYFFFWSGRVPDAQVGHKPHVLDAPLAAANGNPFTISALPTWRRSIGLGITSFAMLAMISIPIFVPGSIVPVQGNLWQPCTIRSPNITRAYLTKVSVSNPSLRRALPDSSGGTAVTVGKGVAGQIVTGDTVTGDTVTGKSVTAQGATVVSPSLTRNLNPIFETTAIVNNIITSGSYLAIPSPCGVCAYQVNFSAVSLDCSSAINNTYDFSNNFPSNPSNSTSITLFNGNLSTDQVLTIATRDGVVSRMNPPAAVSCNAYQANYIVGVYHDNCATRIDVLNITRGRRLSQNSDPSVDQLNGLIQAVGGSLTGRIVLQKDEDNLSEGANSAIAYSPLLQWTSTNGTSNFTWPNLTTSLPSLMQNISLSFLSGRFPASEQPYMEDVQTQCLVVQLVYKYNQNRLLSIYAAAWGAAAIFFVLGFYFIAWKNHGEHNLDFSHVLDQLVAPSGSDK